MDEKIKKSEEGQGDKLQGSSAQVDEKILKLEKQIEDDGKKVQMLETNGIKNSE